MMAATIEQLIERQAASAEVELMPESVSVVRLAERLASLANTDGGNVLVGVGRRGTVGLRHPVLAQDKAVAASAAVDPQLIIPLPKLVDLEGMVVLLISVPPGLPHVYAVRGRYLVRSAGRVRPLAPAELRRLMLERGELAWESRPVSGASLDDLDWDSVERYGGELGGAVSDATELLVRRGCLTADAKPTRAGMLLFGRDPQRFLPHARLTAAQFPGLHVADEFIRQDVEGRLADQIRRAEAFLVANMRVGARLSGLEREERLEYPREAVREAVVNAVAHRDYSMRGDEIRVLMFADRIEIYSPGRLPGPVTVHNLVRERYSRNASIVQVLSDMGYIERLGYGIDRMIGLMRDYGLPEPVFSESAAGFQVTLYGQTPAIAGEPAPAQWAHLALNARQEQAMLLAVHKGRVTNGELQELAPDVSAETIRRDLQDLVGRGLLLKIGDKRGTFYILK
jgi:ATP-dependent DNA helicase RecG